MKDLFRKYSEVLAIVTTILVAVLYLVFVHKSPAQMASDAQCIPQFFNLTASDFTEETGGVYVYDEIHSQGRKWNDFGSAHYEISTCECQPHLTTEIIENGGYETDSTWVLRKVRGNILGEIIVTRKHKEAYVHFYQIYND